MDGIKHNPVMLTPYILKREFAMAANLKWPDEVPDMYMMWNPENEYWEFHAKDDTRHVEAHFDTGALTLTLDYFSRLYIHPMVKSWMG
jgi:hypothetical protein